MCNPGIRDRHWDKMSAIYKRNLKPDTGTTLRKVLQLGLDPYMEQFEQVSAGASKVRLNNKERIFQLKNIFLGIFIRKSVKKNARRLGTSYV